ncbi:MAG: aminoacyl-tRNA hydrolase [Candidatus Izemoplasmataceae bacterium]|jgi:peptidyl-tRNA hydrolase, PTH1 family|uniref:aminoacyl-tRNA hydrolase n=1 Tax=Liberiplasma polymorphum TaxID=3374570 RepID=UPI00377554A7
MKLIVGLGNPGKKYQNTKHNIGFLCLDYFAKQTKQSFKNDKKFQGELIKTNDYILLKPQTFMNLSGISVSKIVTYYNIDLEDILIIYDDLDLPLAKLRLRYQGSDGGHKGMRSIQSSLLSNDLKRVKFGIDKHPHMETKDYVLSQFNKEEVKPTEDAVKEVFKIMNDFIDGIDFVAIMNTYN